MNSSNATAQLAILSIGHSALYEIPARAGLPGVSVSKRNAAIGSISQRSGKNTVEALSEQWGREPAAKHGPGEFPSWRESWRRMARSTLYHETAAERSAPPGIDGQWTMGSRTGARTRGIHRIAAATLEREHQSASARELTLA